MMEIKRYFLEKYFKNILYTHVESEMVETDDPLQEVKQEPCMTAYRITTVTSIINENDVLVSQNVFSTPTIVLGKRIEENKMLVGDTLVDYGDFSMTLDELKETQEQLRLRIK